MITVYYCKNIIDKLGGFRWYHGDVQISGLNHRRYDGKRSNMQKNPSIWTRDHNENYKADII